MPEPIVRYLRFIRPFTLLVPALGMVCGALMGLSADPKGVSDWSPGAGGIFLRIVAGAVLAAALNAFSNGLNQIFDQEIDRINKPHRLLPSGRISGPEAWCLSLVFLVIALSLAAWINLQCFFVVLGGALGTVLYSVPPIRTKSRGLWANLTIAVVRGTLLPVAGWSTVKHVLQPEPWVLGAILGVYFLGAVTTKDFSDMEGDRRGGCRTLPVIHGVQRSIRIIAPFFVLPFLALVPGAVFGFLSGQPLLLAGLGLLLAGWGGWIILLLVRSSREWEGKLDWENHPSWRQMYLLTLTAYIGLASAYLLR